MEKNILQESSAALAIGCYAYCGKLKSNGMHQIAAQLLKEAIETSMASGFASSALSPKKFVEHLEEGYYASGRVLFYLGLVADIVRKPDNSDENWEPFEGHKKLAEEADKIHRMYAASIKTYRKKQDQKEVAGFMH